jgi:hypothetical protein
MFTLSRQGAAFTTAAGFPEMMFLPPAVTGTVEGDPVEEVILLRDEMANMAWGVERIVESRTGTAIDRRDAYQAAHGAPQQAVAAQAGSSRISYRLATEVPDYWIPLVPVSESPNGAIRLRRGMVPRPDSLPAVALGRLLTPGSPLALHDEEVPRAGARVTRSWQYARWLNGSTHLWVGRRKGQGRGEGSSGLRFDAVE